MPPPHPHHLDENGDSKGLPSKIHPSMDNRFFSATTLQLALLFKRQKCQEEESGSKSSASLVGKKSNRWPLNVSGREIIACWNNVWLSTDERAVVKCFQEDRNALFRNIPGLWERDDTIVNKSGLSSTNRDFQGKHTDGTHLRSRLIGWLDEFSLVRDSAKVCIQKELLKVTGSNNVIEETQIAISTIVMPAVFCIGGCLGYTFANSGDIISDSALLLWTAVELFRCSSNICESKSNGSISVVAGRALCFIARHFSRAGYASPAAAIIDLVSKVIREMEVDSAIPRTQVLELVSLLRGTVGMQLASTQQGSKVWLTAMSIYEHYSGRDSFPRDIDNTRTKAVVIDVPIDLAIDEFSTDLNDTAVIDFFCRLFLEPRIFKRAGNSDIDIGTIEFELYSLMEAQCSAECSSVSESSSEVSSRLIKVAKELSCKCLEVPSLKSGRLSSSIQDQWLTRCDCDQAIVKLIILQHQLQADIGDAINTDIDDSTIADKNDDGCGVRSVIRDWFRGFAAISVRGSSGLNTGSSFASMPNIEPQAHLLPDTKSYCDAVQVLCDFGRPHDACWLLQTIASGIGTGYHRTMALTSDLRDPLRIRLENLSEEAGLASSDSAIFTNLIGNMIGCFTIGFLSTGGAFGDVIDRNLAIAPSSWRCIQDNKELQLGLRTGFCGSLTTFASWNHAMLLLFLTDSKQGTANALFGYLIGILLCLISVFIGEYLALVVVIYFTPPADSRYRLLNGEKNEPLLFGIREDSSEQFNNLENQGSSSGDKFTSSFDYSLTERKSEGGNDESTKNEDGVDLGQSTSSLVTVKCLHIFVHFSLLACFTIVLFLFVTLPRESSTVKAAWWSLDRTQYLSLLVAPLGAFARYELSNNLNAWRSDFFVGTFAANLIACILDSIVYGIRDSKNGGNGSDMTMIYSAIGSGIGGCCSTVSTFMTDTIKLIPEHKYELPRSATRYVSVTIVTCCCSSLLIYKITKINYE